MSALTLFLTHKLLHEAGMVRMAVLESVLLTNTHVRMTKVSPTLVWEASKESSSHLRQEAECKPWGLSKARTQLHEAPC